MKDAPNAIRRIARDICTTSERLEEIRRLIDKNSVNNLFSTSGINSAIRCSLECKDIIAQVSGVLGKGGWILGSAVLDKKDIDISLFQAVRWPFLKAKLASPQADLEKVKASLSLLFNSAMANLYAFMTSSKTTADDFRSSNPTHSPYALEIPRLKRWAEQATLKAERTKSRTSVSEGIRKASKPRDVHWDRDEEDAEMRQRFLEFQLRLVKKEEDKRAQEHAAHL